MRASRPALRQPGRRLLAAVAVTVVAIVVATAGSPALAQFLPPGFDNSPPRPPGSIDRKSTRLNSSHSQIPYAVFCLKKKKQTLQLQRLYPPTDMTSLLLHDI